MSQEGTFRIRIRFSSNSLKENTNEYSKNQKQNMHIHA